MDRPRRVVSLDTIRGLSILGILIVSAYPWIAQLRSVRDRSSGQAKTS